MGSIFYCKGNENMVVLRKISQLGNVTNLEDQACPALRTLQFNVDITSCVSSTSARACMRTANLHTVTVLDEVIIGKGGGWHIHITLVVPINIYTNQDIR